MSECKHEWRMGMVWARCTPGVQWVDFECVRCGESMRKRATPDVLIAGWNDRLEEIDMELNYRGALDHEG